MFKLYQNLFNLTIRIKYLLNNEIISTIKDLLYAHIFFTYLLGN
jgi:hypothetical protein